MLSDSERRILQYRLEQKTLEEIGKELRVSRQRVQASERSALAKLSPKLVSQYRERLNQDNKE